MDILYAYSTCSDREYKLLHENAKCFVLPQDHKFHSLLLDGLSKFDTNITCISGRPINRNVSKKFFFKKKSELVNGINYFYYPTINFPVFRQLGIMRNSYKYAKKYLNKNKDALVIVDILFLSNAKGVIKAAKKYGNKILAIVTDPLYDENNDRRFKIRQKITSQADCYLFLTDSMKEVVPREDKPYVVVEGFADTKMAKRDNALIDKHNPKTIVYAGGVLKEYGLDILVNGFIKANLPNAELRIFGMGNYVDEIKRISEINPAVKYMGSVSNDVVVDEEIKATLLVNPRPTGERFTKYSFPSKTIEYMAAGTPVLMTDLYGVGDDYKNHSFVLKEENEKGMEEILRKIFSLDETELYDIGIKAKEFVLEEKNNVKQAEKLYKFLSE